MCKMVDYLDMQACCDAVVSALHALRVPSVSVHDAVAIAFGSIFPNHALTPLKALSFHFLLHLGDVVTVMRSDEKARLCGQLPHAALLDMLHREHLATDSEDSVVTAVSYWVDAQQCRYASKEQLLHALRLLQLSSVYFYTVLSKLQWLQEGQLLGPALWRLAAYAAGDKEAGYIMREATDLAAVWVSIAPRPVTQANGVDCCAPCSSIAVLHSAYITWARLLEELLPALQDKRQPAQQAGPSSSQDMIKITFCLNELNKPSHMATMFTYGCLHTVALCAKHRLDLYAMAQVPAAVSDLTPPPPPASLAAVLSVWHPTGTIPARPVLI